MRQVKRAQHAVTLLAFLLPSLSTLAVSASDSPKPPSRAAATTAVWQHHQASFSYFGITSAYSCDGLEITVRQLLIYFGARIDAKVAANGCPYGPETPGRSAFIKADFYTVSPSSDATVAGAIGARWVSVEVNPVKPFFLSSGDCELLAQIKDVILQNFSLRDVKYHTDCVPYEVNPDDYSISLEALKSDAVPVDSARG